MDLAWYWLLLLIILGLLLVLLIIIIIIIIYCWSVTVPSQHRLIITDNTASRLLCITLPIAGDYSAPQCSHFKRCTSYSNSVCLSVRPSVRHTPVLCQNDGT